MATPSYYVSLGLITIAVKSHPAARSARVELTNLHRPCFEKDTAAKLSTVKVCVGCESEVKDGDVVKGYAVDKDRYVVVSEEDLEALASDKSKSMEVRGFVPVADVDPVYFDKANFLGPADQPAAKAFQLFREAMRKTNRAALVQYVGSGRDKIGLLRVVDEGLMLHDLYFADEVRTYAGQARTEIKPVPLAAEELKLAVELIEASAMAFDLTPFQDGYRERLNGLLRARMEGQPAPKLETRAAPAPVIDLMAALRESVAARKKTAGVAPAASAATPKKGTRKKAA